MLRRQPDFLLVLEQVADEVAGAVVHHARAMSTHRTMSAFSMPFLAVAWLVSPDSTHPNGEGENGCETEYRDRACSLCHEDLLRLNRYENMKNVSCLLPQ